MGWAEERERLLSGESEGTRPMSVSELIELARRTPDDAPWKTEINARSQGDGWLVITDPTTGEEHEIQAHDAHSAWWAQIHGPVRKMTDV